MQALLGNDLTSSRSLKIELPYRHGQMALSSESVVDEGSDSKVLW